MGPWAKTVLCSRPKVPLFFPLPVLTTPLSPQPNRHISSPPSGLPPLPLRCCPPLPTLLRPLPLLAGLRLPPWPERLPWPLPPSAPAPFRSQRPRPSISLPPVLPSARHNPPPPRPPLPPLRYPPPLNPSRAVQLSQAVGLCQAPMESAHCDRLGLSVHGVARPLPARRWSLPPRPLLLYNHLPSPRWFSALLHRRSFPSPSMLRQPPMEGSQPPSSRWMRSR